MLGINFDRVEKKGGVKMRNWVRGTLGIDRAPAVEMGTFNLARASPMPLSEN